MHEKFAAKNFASQNVRNHIETLDDVQRRCVQSLQNMSNRSFMERKSLWNNIQMRQYSNPLLF